MQGEGDGNNNIWDLLVLELINALREEDIKRLDFTMECCS